MKRKKRAGRCPIHLVGSAATETNNEEASALLGPHPGMTRIRLGGLKDENGGEYSICLLQPTELIAKIQRQECQAPRNPIEAQPAKKAKTNLVQLQEYRDEKEMWELEKKLMSLLGL